MTTPDALREYPVLFRLPVQWGEMDAFGHVNNVTYFRYAESARIAYFERVGFTGTVGPILHSTACRFRRPLEFPDELIVGARISALESDRFTMQYAIFSTALGAIAAEVTGVVVAFDYARKAKAQLPAEVRERILALQPELSRTPSPG